MPALIELLKALALALVPWFADLVKSWVENDNEKKESHKANRKRMGEAMRSRDRNRINAELTRRGVQDADDDHTSV